MQELDHGGQFDVSLAAIAQRASAQQAEQGAESLASALDDVLADVLYQSYVGMQLCDDEPVQRLEIRANGLGGVVHEQ